MESPLQNDSPPAEQAWQPATLGIFYPLEPKGHERLHSGIKIYDHSAKFESNLGSDKRGHAAAQPDVRSARVKAFKKRGRKSLLPLPSFRLACFYCISSHLHPETYCTKRQREGEGADRRRGRREGGQGEGRASTTTATSDDIRRKQPSALSLDLFLPPSPKQTPLTTITLRSIAHLKQQSFDGDS